MNAVLLIVSFFGIVCSSPAEWFPVVMESIPYPPVATAAQISGTVRLKVFLSPVGDVERSDVVSGSNLLASAAQRALVRWKFRAVSSGEAKEPKTIELTIEFSLEGTADGRSRLTFRYGHPYRVTVISEAKYSRSELR